MIKQKTIVTIIVTIVITLAFAALITGCTFDESKPHVHISLMYILAI